MGKDTRDIKKRIPYGKRIRAAIAMVCAAAIIAVCPLPVPAAALSGAEGRGQEEHGHTEGSCEAETGPAGGQEEDICTESSCDDAGGLSCGREEHAADDSRNASPEDPDSGWEEHADIKEDPEEDHERTQKGPAAGNEKEDGESRDAESRALPEGQDVNDDGTGTGSPVKPSSGELRAKGKDYTVTVSYTAEAGLPPDAALKVEEIIEGTEKAADGTPAYDLYLERTKRTLGLGEDSFPYARFFDIKLTDGGGQELETAAPVDVRIGLADREECRELNVIHFADGEETGDVLENVEASGMEESAEGPAIAFEADGFSVYALIEAPEPVTADIEYATNLDELAEGVPFLLSYNGTGKYFTNTLNGSGCFAETGLAADASEWYFESAGSAGRYCLCTYVDGQKKYIKNTGGNLVGLVDSGGTILELSGAGTEGKFYFKHGGADKWLQHSNGGGGIRFYTDKNNAANSQISITYASSYGTEDDPCGLDGTVTGIVYDSGSLFCTALMQDDTGAGSIAARDMVKLDMKGHEDSLFVPADSDITEWTFTCAGGDKYYITAGDGRYLAVRDGSAALEDGPSEASLLRAVPGTGVHAGYYSFAAGGCFLAVSGDDNGREFTGTGSPDGRIWFKFAEKSSISKDDYLVYSAKKISASDPAEEVVLYTRKWNGTNYDFYIVDYDGSLIRCCDGGDVVKWAGDQYQTAVWTLTEHTKEDGEENTVPNGYYELRNTYSGRYIKPVLGEDTIFSGREAYLNLDGRYYQEEYTKIRCWDDAYYSYIGLKADLDARKAVPCPSSQADDFYFARIKALPASLTEAETVDNNEFGITIKMIDFNNTIVNGRDSLQTDYFGKDTDRAGLLTTDIDETSGYPVSTHNGMSLGGLFAGGVEANKLFIKSVYDESGYFEFDSTKNYAYLNGSEFEVYDQLGTTERTPYKPTSSHGQFMPYNPLADPATGEPWPYSDMYSNKTTVTGDSLPEDDPRYGEGLHEIPKSKADYFFGMEMSAAFTQTADGTDAWGNDIIFEFSGDDDFWLYVDGELVLDLGGVHSAMSGSVNFRTGTVTGRGGQTKTLREIFEGNYRQRNPDAPNAEVNTYLHKYFEGDSTVFASYSPHTMNIYYMERGAGASNLHMRFNLAAVRPGEVTLSKIVTGSDDVDYDLMEFPYQILYRTQEDIDTGRDWRRLVQDGHAPAVAYAGSKRPVRFEDSYTPAGASDSCEDVFFLKAGEKADITMPVDAAEYKVVECGVNMDIFKSVKANSELLSKDTDTGRKDYAIRPASIEDRPEVAFENEADPESLRTLTVTKVLWDEEGNRLEGYEPDPAVFDFRIAMSAQGLSALTPARNKKYFVRDTGNDYCRWDPVTQRFVSLGISSYTDLAEYLDTLDEAGRAFVVFETSNNGAVSRIPGGFSVEFRGLPVDSSFQVTEREDEIPEGYELVKYERDQGSYISEEEPNRGTIRASQDPHILVHNKRGWGLTVDKVWSDADYMDSHDDIYIGIYLKDPAGGEPSLLKETLRRLRPPSVSLYYYFDQLEAGASFDDYEACEVILTDPVCSADGSVVSYSTAERVTDGGVLTVGGCPKDKEHQEGFVYHAEYMKGQTEGGDAGNVRTDTIRNTRQGIKLVKTDWGGQALPGAVFTLEDEDGRPAGAASYTSAADGLITTAYLDPGRTYTLEETTAPAGFRMPPEAWTVKVEDGIVTVAGEDGSYETAQADGGRMAVVTLKNKGFSLRAVKKDAETGIPLKGAVFALYRQVEAAGGRVRDRRPVPGYEVLTTDTSGIIPDITSVLWEGTYYLTETSPPPGYEGLSGCLVFTISRDGTVEVPQHVDSDDPPDLTILNNTDGWTAAGWLSSGEQDGHTAYTITVPNEAAGAPVKIIKTDRSGHPVAGAEFDLHGDGISEEGLVSMLRETGPLGDEGNTAAEALIYENPALPAGIYTLTETEAPAGCYPLKGDITVTVASTPAGIAVAAEAGEDPDCLDVVQDPDTGVWTIRIMNRKKVIPPYTDIPGTHLVLLLAFIFTALTGSWLLLYRKRARQDR